MSYSACPVQPVLFCLSYSACLSCFFFPVLPVMVLPIRSWLSCHGSLVLPVPYWLSYSSCPVLVVLFCLSCSACPVRPSCSACPVPPVLFCLSYFACPPSFACPVLPALFCLSYSVRLSCSAYHVLSWLSCHGSLVLPILCCLSCSACSFLPVLFCLSFFWLSCSGCPVLIVCGRTRTKWRMQKSMSGNSESAKKSAKIQDHEKIARKIKEHGSTNAKAQNLRPKKERESASAKSFDRKRESASAKTKKSECPALERGLPQSHLPFPAHNDCQPLLVCPPPPPSPFPLCFMIVNPT